MGIHGIGLADDVVVSGGDLGAAPGFHVELVGCVRVFLVEHAGEYRTVVLGAAI